MSKTNTQYKEKGGGNRIPIVCPCEVLCALLRGRIGLCLTEGFRGGFGPFSRDGRKSRIKKKIR